MRDEAASAGTTAEPAAAAALPAGAGQTAVAEPAAAAPAEAAAAEPAKEGEAAKPAAVEEKVRVGNKEFASMDEAFAFLDTQQAAPAAGSAQQVVPVDDLISRLQQPNLGNTQADPEKVKEQFYEDPVAFTQQAIKTAVSANNQQWENKNASASADQQAYDFMWNRHPGLKDKKDIVDLVITEQALMLQALPTIADRADAVALHVKKRLSAWGVPASSKKPLDQTTEQAADGSSVGVTPVADDGKILSMHEQMSQNQKRMGY